MAEAVQGGMAVRQLFHGCKGEAMDMIHYFQFVISFVNACIIPD